jgi:hypothetical protein
MAWERGERQVAWVWRPYYHDLDDRAHALDTVVMSGHEAVQATIKSAANVSISWRKPPHVLLPATPDGQGEWQVFYAASRGASAPTMSIHGIRRAYEAGYRRLVQPPESLAYTFELSTEAAARYGHIHTVPDDAPETDLWVPEALALPDIRGIRPNYWAQPTD